MPPKLLLSSVFRPFGVDDEHCRATTLAEFHHSNLTGAQGHFSIRGANPHLGLHFLAENLRAPVVLLENPSLDEFRGELAAGGYSHAGISFEPATCGKAELMCREAKRVAPGVRTVLGGYGTAVEGVERWADHVCRGEGVRFMRQLLGEDEERPLRHPRVYNTGSRTLGVVDLGTGGVIAAGLGCPRGCEFCLTSHFFKCKHIPFMRTGQEIFDVMVDVAEGMPRKARTGSYDLLVLEEDFLLDSVRVRELAQCMRRPGAPFLVFSCFGDAAALSRYAPAELAAMGLDCVWVGVEGPSAPGYGKLRGVDVPAVIKGLHDAGIMTVCSMIIGFDSQDEAAVERDIDWHLSLGSTFNQFMLYTPLPGTPLFRAYAAEGRILDRPWKDFDGWHFTVRHPHLSPERAEALQAYGYRRDFERLGPSILRSVEVSLKGWRGFRGSTDPLLERRAEANRAGLEFALALFPAAKAHAPNDHVRRWVQDLEARIVAEVGPPPLRVRAAAAVIRARLALTDAWRWLTGAGDVLQVRLCRTEFRSPSYEVKILKLKDDLWKALAPYGAQFSALRERGARAVEAGVEAVERSAEAVAVEVRATLDREELKRLREKLAQLAASGAPLILYASAELRGSVDFARFADDLRRWYASVTVLPQVDELCLQLAALAPVRVIS